MQLVDVLGVHLEATTGDALVLLREHDAPHRYLPMFIGDAEAAAIAYGVAGDVPPRPMTHDVMAALVDRLGGHVDAVEITDLRDGAFIALVALSGPTGDQRLDSRPSDAIALALRLGAPVYVDDEVLELAGALPDDAAHELDDGSMPDAMEEQAIDEQIARFRVALEHLEPSDFADAPTPPSEADRADAADRPNADEDEDDNG
jgi:bifunctional DNase/RNase